VWGEAASPLVKLEHALLSWNAIAIMPIFELANAGVAEGGEASGV
jgi:Na+/H+ antiporter NhaA